MLKIGDVAPPFSAMAHDGSSFDLSGLRGTPVVVFFFPKANTLGCTREAKAFQSIAPGFRSEGTAIVGVSVDPMEAEQSFAERCEVSYPIVPDIGASISRRYGVLGLFGMSRRVTFVVGGDGRIARVIDSLRPTEHARLAAEAVAELRRRPASG